MSASDGRGDAVDAAPDLDGSFADASTDGLSDAGDVSSPSAAFRWVALPTPRGTPITAITVDSEGVLYAGAGGSNVASSNPSAGLFKSTDEGASWHPINYGAYDLHVASLFANGATVYAGTANLLRSIDRGATWQQVTPAESVGQVSAIGAQGNLVIAASSYGGNPLDISQDGGNTFTRGQFSAGSTPSVAVLGSVILRANDSGITRSIDGGATFTAVQGVSIGSALSAQLACDGISTCYANAHNTSSIGPSVLLKSVDAGATWTPLSLNNAAVLAVSDTGVVYVSAGSVIARSDDGGATFVSVNRPTTTGAFQPNCVGPYAARGNELFAGCPDGVYRSADKGQHWQAANGSPTAGAITGPAASILVDTSATSLAPSGDLYVVGPNPSSYQLRRSTDGGWTWQVLAPSSSGSCVVTSSGALVCVLEAGTSGAITVQRSADHGVTWQNATLPATAPGTPPSVSVVAAGGSGVYASGNAGVARSNDDGRTFQLLPGSPAAGSLQVLRSGHVLAASTTSHMVYRSSDQGATWQALPRLFPVPLLEDGTGRLIYSDTGPGIVVSTDEGDPWQSLSTGVPYHNSGDPAIMGVDGAGRLYLVARGSAPGNNYLGAFQLYVSLDSGANWMPFPVPIPNQDVRAFATDKQGRLLAATAGGLFRLELTADPGPPPPDGGAGGTDGGSTAPPPRRLSLVVDNGPWSSANPLGFGVDAAGRTYVSNDNNVYVVDAGTVSTYLTTAEVTSGAGLAYAARFVDLDVGPDALLYVMVAGGLVGSTSSTDVAVRSSAAHQATLWRDLGTLNATRMVASAAGQVAFLDPFAGFSTATGSAVQLVYPSAALQLSAGCPFHDFAVAPTGAVAFLPGCVANQPVQRGTLAGATPTALYQPSSDPINGETFACTAGDPAGGFYFVVTGPLGASPRLYHAADNATGPTALSLVVTEPTLGEVRVARGGGEFSGCNMAVAPNGVVYLQTAKGVWKLGL